MRVSFLGHATVLVELDRVTCVMDPVFFDPFEEGAVVSCPRRTVHPEQLPAVDIVVVSHRHPDHFDLRSLAALSRDCDVICPGDPVIVYALRQLGFDRVHPVHPMGEISGEGFELFPTRSELQSIPEFGMVFEDRSGKFWNQVDSVLSQETISAVLGRFGHIDLLSAMYASQNFDFFEDLSREFPYADHAQNLQNVLRIHPGVAVPGSAGFRFADELAWLNSFLFPISPQRFVADLERICPEVRAPTMNPGDVFEIDNGETTHHPAASGVAHMDRDDTELIAFNPVAPIPELTDPNLENHRLSALAQAAGSTIDRLSEYVREADDSDVVVARYRNLEASYGIDVVLPDGSQQSARLSPARREVVKGLAAAATADVAHHIAASTLLDWVEYRRSFFHVRGWSRRYQTPYRLVRHDDNLGVEKTALPDLLIHYVTNVAPGSETAAKCLVDAQLSELGLGS